MILDELLVRLGFKTDTKGLAEFEKKAFSVKSAMLGIGSAIAVAGIGEWIGKTVEKLADVQKLATVVQMPAKSIAALGRVAVENEGSIEGMNEMIETLTKTTGQAALGIGRGAMVFKKLGLHAKDSSGHVKDFNQILGDVADKMQGKSRTEQLGMASRLGIDPHLLDILGQGRQKIEELTAAAAKANPLSNSDYEKALITEKMFVKTKASITAVSNQIAVKLLPVIDQALTAISAWFNEARHSDAFANLIKMVISFASDLGAVVGFLTSVIGKFAAWGPGAAILKTALGALIALKMGAWLTGIAKSAVDAATALWKTATATGGLQKALSAGLLVFLGLAIEDLWQFYNGGLSVTGMLVNKWAPALNLIKAGIVALSALWVTSMVPVGVASAIGFLPLYLAVLAVGALIYALYQLKTHWAVVMDYIAAKINPIIDKVNKIREAFGFSDIEHMTGGSEDAANEQAKKAADPNLKWEKVTPVPGKPGVPIKVTSSGIHMVPQHIVNNHAGHGGVTHVTQTHLTIQKLEVKANNPEELGHALDEHAKLKNRTTIRNALSKTVL